MKINRRKFITYLVLLAVIAVFSVLELPTYFREGFSYYVFDVGQGDSSLFIFDDGRTMLVDAGPRKSAKSLTAKLRKLGVRRIDILVATHPHEDHIGGAAEIINSFEVGRVWDSGYIHGSATQKAMLEAIRDNNVRYGKPKAGFSETVGEVKIDILAPPAAGISGSRSDANNNSIVLAVRYGEISFLLMGDIEERGREKIAAYPPSAVLKVSHHGSRNGTDRRLLDEAAPDVAIISCAAENSYGHPHEQVLRLLEDSGAHIYSTRDGDIRISSDGSSYEVEQIRL